MKAIFACVAVLLCFVGFACAYSTDFAEPIIFGSIPIPAPNSGGLPNPDAVFFEKRVSPNEVAFNIPEPVPELQYVEKNQDRPMYTKDENPCSILGNRNILLADATPGATQPKVVFETVTPHPIMDHNHEKTWYSWSSTRMTPVVAGIGEVVVTYYVEITPAPGDSVKAVGFDPGDGTKSRVSGVGGSVSGGGKSWTIVDGVPITYTEEDGVVRAYISHTYSFSSDSLNTREDTRDFVAKYKPSIEVTTTNGCRAYVNAEFVKVWANVNKTVSNEATVHIDSNVVGTNIWLNPYSTNFDVGAFGVDPLLGGYLGETPLTITVPVTEPTQFNVWAREFGYDDKTAPGITLNPGGEYTITFDMEQIEESRCYLSRGYVVATDSKENPIDGVVVYERISKHPSLCNLWDWYKCETNEFYCEYYSGKESVYDIELIVTAPGYENYNTTVTLEALTQKVVRVNMTAGVSTPVVTITPTPSPTFTPPLVENVGDAATNYEISQLVYNYTNYERTRLGFPELVWDNTLADMARYHSNDQILTGYMGHVSPSGETIVDRMEMFGLVGTVGENIHMHSSGYTADELASKAVLSLMQSPTHRDNILSRDFTTIGIGVASNATVTIVTQEFS